MKTKRIIRNIFALWILASLVLLSACDKSKDSTTPSADNSQSASDSARTLQDCGVIHEQEFGGIYIKTTIDDFNALGYHYGDSVDVVFSNGYTLNDIPYYNGFYSQVGEPILIAYPGYDYIKAVISYGDDLWKVAELNDNDTATVSLAQAGKFSDIQAARDMSYEDERKAYDSDEEFTNFRSINAGNIKENMIYRSASPCDNQHNRASYVDKLMGDAGVNYIINLSDNEEKIAGYMAADDFNSPNFIQLYESGNISPLALDANYTSEEFREGVAKALSDMVEQDGPFLIHCTEGKDRTGFVCMLIEALCGASYDEIVADYMLSYDNYYHVNQTSDADKYKVIVREVLNPMIQAVVGDENVDIHTADLSGYAEKYLAGIGLSDDTIARLKVLFCSE